MFKKGYKRSAESIEKSEDVLILKLKHGYSIYKSTHCFTIKKNNVNTSNTYYGSMDGLLMGLLCLRQELRLEDMEIKSIEDMRVAIDKAEKDIRETIKDLIKEFPNLDI